MEGAGMRVVGGSGRRGYGGRGRWWGHRVAVCKYILYKKKKKKKRGLLGGIRQTGTQ